MTNTITNALAARGLQRTGSDAIITIVADEHNVHCMTEELLDTWWAGLSPEEKGEVFDRAHDDPAPTFLPNGNLLDFLQAVDCRLRESAAVLSSAEEVRHAHRA